MQQQIEFNREKNLETCLVIATGLIVIGLIFDIRWLFYVAIALGVIGVFINPLARWVSWLWYKIAEVMGFVMSKVLLTIVFFLVLLPVALVYRAFNKDTLQLKRSNQSYWRERSHSYEKKDLENVW